MKECYQFWEYLGGFSMLGAWTVIWLGYRQGWRIVKCKLVPGRNDYSGARKNA